MNDGPCPNARDDEGEVGGGAVAKIGGVVDVGLPHRIHHLRDPAVEGVVGVGGLGRGEAAARVGHRRRKA